MIYERRYSQAELGKRLRWLAFMAKYGIRGVIGGGSAEGGAVERHMPRFQAAYARRGIHLELGERLALDYQFDICSIREQAMRDPWPVGTVKLPTTGSTKSGQDALNRPRVKS